MLAPWRAERTAECSSEPAPFGVKSEVAVRPSPGATALAASRAGRHGGRWRSVRVERAWLSARGVGSFSMGRGGGGGPFVAVACACLCGFGFIGLFVWQRAVVAGQADDEWTVGVCEVYSGTLREVVGEQDSYYVTFSTRFYHERTDIESPLNVMSNEWGDPDGSVWTGADWAASEKESESYRRSVIDCCGSPGSGAVWGYTDGAACDSTPRCNASALDAVEDYLFTEGSAHKGVHSFGCGLCLECCSAMEYELDPSTYTGHALIGAYKRPTCYVRTEDFDEYAEAHNADDLDGLLWVRLHPEETYDWWEDESTRGYFWPIFFCIVGALCLGFACVTCVDAPSGSLMP